MSLWILKPATLFRTFVHFATTRAREYIYRGMGSDPGEGLTPPIHPNLDPILDQFPTTNELVT